MPQPDLLAVVGRMGLARRRDRVGPCPVCRADRDREGRPPVRVTAAHWWCNACGEDGSVVALVAWWMLGRAPAQGDPELRRVYEYLDGGSRELEARPVAPAAPAPVVHADSAALVDFLRLCRPVAQDEACAAFLRGRGIDPAVAPAGAVPVGLERPWWPRAWSSSWRVVVAAHDHQGVVRNVHARAIDGRQPKTRWAAGLPASGLVFANPAGRALLRGECRARALVITEGLPDFLDAASQEPDVAVLSVESGSADLFRRVALPPRLEVFVGTHADAAGDQYARRIAAALAPRFARRLPLHLARHREAVA